MMAPCFQGSAGHLFPSGWPHAEARPKQTTVGLDAGGCGTIRPSAW